MSQQLLLDPDNAQEIMDLIRSLKIQNRIIIIATHNPGIWGTSRSREAAAAPSGLKEMQDCHPAVVYQTEKSLWGLFCVAKVSILTKIQKVY